MTPDAQRRLDALPEALRALARDSDEVHDALTRHVRDGAPLDAVLLDAHRELVRLWRVMWWAYGRPAGVTEYPPCPWATMPDGDAETRAAWLRALLDGARAFRGGRVMPTDERLLWRPGE